MIDREIRYTKIIYILLIISAIVNGISFSQNTASKKAGICFRTDDNQPISKYIEYASLFNKYNQKFTFAINLGRIEYDYPDSYNYYINSIREIQSHGHEMMDHTPWHRTNNFKTNLPTDFYHNHPGVQKINGYKIELKYNDIDINLSKRNGYVNINGDVVTSPKSDFKNFERKDCYLYFPDLDKLVFIHETNGWIDNSTVKILDFWWNPIDLGTVNNIKYYNFDYNNVHLTKDAIKALAQEAVRKAEFYDLQRPYSWIQPGGYHPHIHRNELMQAISSDLGFKSAGIFPDPSLKVFNEYNPDNDKQFGMNFGDFRDDIWTLEACKSFIADNIAKHHVLIGENHFTWGSDGLLGGWAGFLNRTEELIKWSIAKNIPIRTYSEWADILYNTTPDPSENIFPELNIDLNENSIPDGYEYISTSVLDKTDSPNFENFSLKTNGKNTIAIVKNLGGIEKGENYFEIWTKGSIGNFVEVDFKIGSDHKVFKFPAENSEWIKYDISQSINGTTTLYVPINVSLIDVTIRCSNYSNGDVKISGMKLYKQQSQSDYLAVSPSELILSPEEGINQFNISSNSFWNIEENLDWLDLSIYSGSANHEITINYNENFSTNPREGKIKILCSNQLEEINVYQSGKYPIINISTDSIFVSSDSIDSIIHVISNTDWSTCVNVDWIKIFPTEGSGDFDINLSICQNQVFESRDATIKVLYNEEIYKSIYVHQDAKEEILNLSIDSLFINSDSSKINLQIESNTSWSINNDISWISFSKVNGTGNDLIFIEASQNKSLDFRNGIISISSLTKNLSLFIYQNGESPTISTSVDTINVNSDSTITSLNIFSNVKWKIDKKPEWLSVQPDSGIGNQQIVITVKENPDTVFRRNSFIIKSNYIDKSIKILQHAREVYKIFAYTDSISAGEIIGNGKYIKGTTVNLTARPNSGWKFLNWIEGDEIISTDSILIFTAMLTRTLKVNFKKISTGLNEDYHLSKKFYLYQNYPNPFNPTTSIKYSIPTTEIKVDNAQLIIYDILGKEVDVLVNEYKSPGNYEIQFNATNLASGIYYCKLIFGKMLQTRKLLLIK